MRKALRISGLIIATSCTVIWAQSTSPLYCPWPSNTTSTVCVAPTAPTPTPKPVYRAPAKVDPNKCPGGTGTVWPAHTNDANAEFLAKCGIIVRQTDTNLYRFSDKILRQEVVGMADKIRGLLLPGTYQCRGYFADVMQNSPNSWVCRAAEVAADYNMITRANGIFRPEENVTKSEGLAMMLAAVCLQPVTQEQVNALMANNTKFAADAVDWQKRVMVKYNSIKAFSYTDFKPNACATRSELFDFAVNTLNYTAANGQCYSTICDQLRGTNINVIPSNSLVYTLRSATQAVTQFQSLGGAFSNITSESQLIDVLQSQYPFLSHIDSFSELMEYIESDPLLATATNVNDLVRILNDYASFGTEIGDLPGYSSVNTTSKFLSAIQKIPGFEDVENLGSFIQTLNNFPGFENVRTVDDLIDVLGDYKSFSDFSQAVSLASLLGNINIAFPSDDYLEDESDFISMINDFPGFENVTSLPQFFSILSAKPGFAGVDTIGEFLDRMGDFSGFDSFADTFNAMQIEGLGGIFDGATNPDKLLDAFQNIPGLENASSLDAVVEILNDRAAFSGINDFSGLASALVNYPEARNITSGSAFNTFLNDYDKFIDKINDYSSFANVNSVSEFLDLVNNYTGFENVASIGEFMTVLKSKYPNLFPASDTLSQIIPKLGEVNQLFNALGGN